MKEIPDWQKEQIRKRTEAYRGNPSSAQDFDEAIKDVEQILESEINKLSTISFITIPRP